MRLPWIVKNTAGAVYTFSTNKPHVFIETNIRRVFIHEFFENRAEISDKEILKLVEKSLPAGRQAREWYYALMDYGVYLAKNEVNPNRKSKHYAKQSKFEGSIRQIRGKILKILLSQKKISIMELEEQFENKEKLQTALEQLLEEGFIIKNLRYLSLR